MKFGMNTLTVFALIIGVLGANSAHAATATANPEFQLVEGLMAASGDDLGSGSARAAYQQQVNTLLQNYASVHTADPNTAMQNLTSAFQVMGISSHEVAQIQTLSARYAPLFAKSSTLNEEESKDLWTRYGQDLGTALQSVPYPQGAEFSACQWSVSIMTVGLAVGIPLTAYTIGEGMGDQNVSGWISAPGVLFFLAGFGGLIATIPTCLF